MDNKTNKTNRQNIWSLLGEPTQEKKSGLAYSAAVVMNVLLSVVLIVGIALAGFTTSAEYESEDWFLYCSFLLPQLAFAIVAAIYFFKTKTPVQSVAAKCKPKYFLLALLMQVGLLSLSELNTLFLQFLGRFGYESADISLPSLNGFGLFGVLITVALLPAIFEETIFRGILLSGLKKFGSVAAVLVCGLLFSLYHQNPAQTIYQFLCGAAFAWIALRSGSILPTVLAHFLNNALIILLKKFGLETFSTTTEIVLIVLSALCLIFAILWLIFIDRKQQPDAEKPKETKTADKKGFFLCAAVGILVCLLTWITTFISGLS
jgi:membrane protease YdiL (CAAX protease family)